MRWVYRLALTLAVIAPLHAPAFAAEPEAPAVLIGATEAIRIAIQNRLSAKFTAASNARKSEQGALVEFYSAPEHHLLWVDDKELTDRGKMVMAEIAKADDYGLRASDYALPKPDTFDASDPKATDWLADAEIKISFAVLGYANDARGGRINPSRLARSKSCAPQSIVSDRIDCLPLRSCGLFAELPAGSAAVRSVASEATGITGRQPEERR